MVFEGGIDGDVYVVLTTCHVGEILEKDIGRKGRVGTGIEGHRTVFQWGEEVGREMRGRGVGHPNALWEEFAQHHGRGLAFDYGDGFWVSGQGTGYFSFVG